MKMRLKWTIVLVAVLLPEMLPARAAKLPNLNDETNSQRDEEGLGEARQRAADIVENGTETRGQLNNSTNADENNLEAFVQNTQHNLQGKDSDEDMQERIDEYIENGDVGDGDAIHIADILTNMTISNDTIDDNKRFAMVKSTTLWEKGIIPYDFETASGKAESDAAKAKIRADLDYLSSVSCLKFVPWTSNTKAEYDLPHDTRLWFYYTSGCVSYVGRIDVEKQEISACQGQETLHEVIHALGADHEQSRSDSSHVLQFNWDNIQDKYKDQFAIADTDNVVPYDLGSIMQYSKFAFSSNQKPTMEVYDNDLDFLLGKRGSEISFYDIESLNIAYQCIERNCPDTTLDCKNNGFVGYINQECKCVCPDGLTGDTCEELIQPDCGGIIDLTDTASISAPVDEETGLYSNNMECRWLVRAPEKTQIKLRFTKFDIEVQEWSTSCEDYLEIMHHSITAPGDRYCGSRFERSLISNGPYMMLVFRTGPAGVKQGFNAEFSVVVASDYDYNLANKGLSYAGDVSYTQKYKKCMDWDKVTNCSYSIFKENIGDNVLGGHNKCRNPSVTEQPWCYTDCECNSDFCDVAGLGECYDKLSNCAEKLAEEPGYANTDEAFEMCHKSAGKCGQGVAPAVGGCGAAPSAQYANVTSEVKDYYIDGDVVTYKCNTGFGTHKRICLSDGSWSEDSKLCGACPRGWYEGGGACYFTSIDSKPYGTARAFCQEMGGDLPIVANQADDDILKAAIASANSGINHEYYIGASDADTEGEFKWIDGTDVTIQHFAEDTQTVNNYDWFDCVDAFVNNGVYTWSTTYCHWNSRYMCRVPRTDNLCSDSRSDCQSLISRNGESNICTQFPRFSGTRCRRSCGLCAEGTIDIM